VNVEYLYAGADVSGRELLLGRGSGRKLEGVIGRAVTALSITVAAFIAEPSGPQIRHAVGTDAVQLDVADILLERVWKARSDRIQPTDKARRRASAVLEGFREAGIEPDRVVADPDGGVAVYVFGRRELQPGTQARHARVLAANEGDLIALCVDYEHNTHDVWETDLVELGATVSKMQSFLAG
jgi:hypothetical protein